MGRVRTFFPKILQGVRFLVDGYVYTGPYSTVTTDEMIHQSDEMIQYLSWPSKAADLICLWRLKLNFNEQYLSVNELTKSCPIFM